MTNKDISSRKMKKNQREEKHGAKKRQREKITKKKRNKIRKSERTDKEKYYQLKRNVQT